MRSATHRSPCLNFKSLCRLVKKGPKLSSRASFIATFSLGSQVRKEEQTEKKEAAAAAAARSSLLDYDRKSDPSEMEMKKKEYVKQNKGSFDDLTRMARIGYLKVSLNFVLTKC